MNNPNLIDEGSTHTYEISIKLLIKSAANPGADPLAIRYSLAEQALGYMNHDLGGGKDSIREVANNFLQYQLMESRPDSETGHPLRHDADSEPCDECSGTRYPVEAHNEWCPLYERKSAPDTAHRPSRHTFWDVSAAHIMADDVKLLENQLGPVSYGYDEGFFIPVPAGDDLEETIADMEALAVLRKTGLHECVRLRRRALPR